jgi:hypothetical protein
MGDQTAGLSRPQEAAESIALAIKGCLRGREGDNMDTADIEHEAQKASDGLTTNALIPAAARQGRCYASGAVFGDAGGRLSPSAAVVPCLRGLRIVMRAPRTAPRTADSYRQTPCGQPSNRIFVL